MLKEKKSKSKSNELSSSSNNQCTLVGKLTGRFELSHQMKFQNFYKNTIKVMRLSGNVDEISIIVPESENEIDFSKDYTDAEFALSGRVQTYNYGTKGKRHKKVYVYVTSCKLQPEEMEDENNVFIEGRICSAPINRKTPKGIDITDICVAVKTPSRKSSYVPCVAWNSNALEVAEYQPGDCVRIKGRIQSREYLKRYPEDPDKTEVKTAYEVAVRELEKLA